MYVLSAKDPASLCSALTANFTFTRSVEGMQGTLRRGDTV
jgi:hypothetical protein